MLQEIEETAQRLLDLVRKRDDRTLAEDRDMTSSIDSLMKCDHVINDGRERPMTEEQKMFVRYILPTALRYDIPKLDDMMRVYGLSLQSVFRYEQSPEDYDACAAMWTR
jgi:hypothetical protein